MSEITIYVLTADDRTLIQNTNRLLVVLNNGAIARRASALGMDEEEVAEAWRLLDASSGRHRSFATTLSAVMAGDPADVKGYAERITRLDGFENEWFPLTRTALARYVPVAEREKVETAFWTGLKQQPLGPAVVTSVDLFLDRLKELKNSDQPWAGKVITSLAKKGLTDALWTATAQDVAAARAITLPESAPEDLAQRIDAANRTQIEALDELRRWYNDAAESLRRLPYHDRQQLGLLSPSERGAPPSV